jgi:hypothetical protein
MKAVGRNKFFFVVTNEFGALRIGQIQGLNILLDCLEADQNIVDARWAAYMLATTKRETGNTFHPIEEYGKGEGHAYGAVNVKTGQIYYGRGYVQCTWYANYLALTTAWNKAFPERQIDFTVHPELLLQTEYSYFAMSYGMRRGAYTGVGLSTYINDKTCDYVNARRIINGTDCADMIAGYAKVFETALS